MRRHVIFLSSRFRCLDITVSAHVDAQVSHTGRWLVRLNDALSLRYRDRRQTAQSLVDTVILC
jgi:hypothetical protein